ncbi:MAG: hypothetical protein IKU72_03955 [Oscillospiraceae bacterium]|nr:hypothetical protein [Oscillospiraceae bacterium]
MSKVLIAVFCLLLLCGCANSDGKQQLPLAEREAVVEGAEVFCLAQTEEEAEAIAARYGIELVDFESGVAAFHTQEDWYELIERGKEQGWPELSPNYLTKFEE